MNRPRVPLYERLPEIYRIKDAEQSPPGQLRAYLAAVERAFSGVHENIEALYDDLFIETADDWAVPYIGDLLGTSHLSGPPRTLRADVADTIALRRRKGTLAALERLAANLTGWAAHAVELFPRLAWAQHLNHQRPDAGGRPPYAEPGVDRFTVPRGGTVPVRDPAMLSLLGTPFGPFAYTADTKRADDGQLHVNLPNLAIFLWRLSAWRLAVTVPLAKGFGDAGAQPATVDRARYAVRFDLDPLDRPVRLFNLFRRAADRLTDPDRVPAEILPARLDSASQAGNPAAYVGVDLFDDFGDGPEDLDLSDAGLQLFLRRQPFEGVAWRFRGDNLCAWEDGLRRPLGRHEIVVDPTIGRLLIGVPTAAERNALIAAVPGGFAARIFAGYSYGAVGPVGAHPVSRDAAPAEVGGQPADLRPVAGFGGTSLQAALAGLHTAPGPVVVEIRDSLVHDLDPTTLAGSLAEGGLVSLRLARPLTVRAAAGHRPTIRLAAPLGFRPVDAAAPEAAALDVLFQGVHLVRADDFAPAGGPLVARAAVASLTFDGCTLDPGGHRLRDGSRAPLLVALALANGYGFADAAEADAFAPTPDIRLLRSVTGALGIDDGYRLALTASIVDAGRGVGDDAGADFAIAAATQPADGWGAPLAVDGATLFGRTRVLAASGSGGIFVHRLEVLDHQHGCLKFCWFAGDGDRLPPNHACVDGTEAKLAFVAIRFGEPAYGQLAPATDMRVRERGPDDDEMGAFGFLLNAHKRRNLAIRLREFMPAGIRPLVLPAN